MYFTKVRMNWKPKRPGDAGKTQKNGGGAQATPYRDVEAGPPPCLTKPE